LNPLNGDRYAALLPLSLRLLLLAGHGLAQSGPTLIRVAYTNQPAIFVAPGEIVRMEVVGLKTTLPPMTQAVSAPLPTNLSGISVTIREYYKQFLADPFTLSGSLKAPIVAIQQAGATYLTFQIPYELYFNDAGNPYYQHDLIISEAAGDSPPSTIIVHDDQIQVITSCDQNPYANPCSALVTHADGTPVSVDSPAVPNETVVIYSWGLGYVNGNVKTGDLTPSPVPVVRGPIRELDWIS
jgi:uncharacterized protein (TIGR03437 family)